MNESVLTEILKAMFNSPKIGKTEAKFLFGIQHADELTQNINLERIAEKATGSASAAEEIRKGKLLAKHVQIDDDSRTTIEEAIKQLAEKPAKSESTPQNVVNADKKAKTSPPLNELREKILQTIRNNPGINTIGIRNDLELRQEDPKCWRVSNAACQLRDEGHIRGEFRDGHRCWWITNS